MPLKFVDAADGNKEKDIPGLGRPLKELADDPTVATCGHKDWDDVDNFVKTIRPPRARRFTDAQAVARGRQLFVDDGRAKCHGGAGWTVSRRYFVPEGARNATLAATNLDLPGVAGVAPIAGFAPTWVYPAPGNSARKHIGGQPPIPADDTGDAEAAAIASSARPTSTTAWRGRCASSSPTRSMPFTPTPATATSTCSSR